MATILVIDDDDAVGRTVRRMLESSGHVVLEAENGKVGLEVVRARSPDLVITDILMPDQEGIETITRLRAVSRTPVIAMSGSRARGDYDVLADAKALGADIALEKPFHRDQLLDAVGRLLTQREEGESQV